MPKRQSRRNDSEYLRFRPYHAFTSAKVNPTEDRKLGMVWRVVLGLAIVGAAIAGALLLTR